MKSPITESKYASIGSDIKERKKKNRGRRRRNSKNSINRLNGST